MAKLAVRFAPGTVVASGVTGGLIFAAFEMVSAAVLMGPEAAAMPLRMIGAMVLGPAALDPAYPVAVAGMAGVAAHMVLSIVFAGIFSVIASFLVGTRTGEFRTAAAMLAVAGILFGIALWLVNFYVVAPLAGWTWLPERSDPVVQFLAHAFFFGCPVGWMLGRSQPLIGPTL